MEHRNAQTDIPDIGGTAGALARDRMAACFPQDLCDQLMRLFRRIDFPIIRIPLLPADFCAGRKRRAFRTPLRDRIQPVQSVQCIGPVEIIQPDFFRHDIRRCSAVVNDPVEHPVLLHVLTPHVHRIHEQPRRIQRIEPLFGRIRRMGCFALECKIPVIGSLDLRTVFIAKMDHRRIFVRVKSTVVRHDALAAPELFSGCAHKIDPDRQVRVCFPQRQRPEQTDAAAVRMPAGMADFRERIILAEERSFRPLPVEPGRNTACQHTGP